MEHWTWMSVFYFLLDIVLERRVVLYRCIFGVRAVEVREGFWRIVKVVGMAGRIGWSGHDDGLCGT